MPEEETIVNKAIDSALEYIDSNIQNNITVDSISDFAGLTNIICAICLNWLSV